MRINTILFLLCCFLHSYAQEATPKENKKGTINYELAAGLHNSLPVGVYFKELRKGIKDREAVDPNYSGKLLPKTAAYTALMVDYQFHKVGAIGFGMRWAPIGWWVFEEQNDIRTKSFYTVDYLEMPIFYQEYFGDGKFSVRWGPVFSFAALTKVRIQTIDGDDNTKEKYRFGQNGVSKAKEMVPGFEFAFNYGNNKGAHLCLAIKYGGSAFEEVDAKTFTANLGFGYTFSNK